MWGRLAALALGGGLLYGGGVGLRATLALRADAAGFAEVPATFTRHQQTGWSGATIDQLRWTYTVGGQPHEGQAAVGWPGLDAAEADRLVAGGPHPVFHDPADPGRSVLSRTPALGVDAALAGAGALLVLVGLWPRRRKDQRKQA
ncbi:MAG: DUF3592 domain-containing protein [Myxococcales bacterium]|nr:DUF3592 domain-containing protein [Myxococcales bacterium]